MLSFSVKSTLDKIAPAFDTMSKKQVPFATSLALNRTAEFAKSALQSNLSVVFDRPKPFTMNSIFIKRSSKTNLVATIFHSDKVAPYITPEIKGGVRSEKSFEVLLGRQVLVPTKNVRLDAYGGVSRAYIAKVLNAAQSGTSQEFILVKQGQRSKLQPGIYQRKNGKIRMLFAFKSSAHYTPRYDMLGVVQRTVNSQFGTQFAAAMDYALGTAKIRL